MTAALTDALMPFVACLPIAALLIQAANGLTGETTREIERAAEAAEWLIAMEEV